MKADTEKSDCFCKCAFLHAGKGAIGSSEQRQLLALLPSVVTVTSPGASTPEREGREGAWGRQEGEAAVRWALSWQSQRSWGERSVCKIRRVRRLRDAQ